MQEKKGSLLLAWQVRDRHCLVIGSGDVALSRINHLLIAQAKITVITGESKIHPQILELYHQGAFHRFEARNYKVSDLSMYKNESTSQFSLETLLPAQYEEVDNYVKNSRFEVVCCCIDDHELSTQIYYQCKVLNINANIADKPPLCDFYFGSMINKDSLQIMISTNGKSPRLLRIIKDIINDQIKDIDLNKAIDNLNLIRGSLRSEKLSASDVNTIDLRMNWIKDLTDFFSIKQWSVLDINHEKAMRVINKYPDFPPKDYEEFKAFLN